MGSTGVQLSCLYGFEFVQIIYFNVGTIYDTNAISTHLHVRILCSLTEGPNKDITNVYILYFYLHVNVTVSNARHTKQHIKSIHYMELTTTSYILAELPTQ